MFHFFTFFVIFFFIIFSCCSKDLTIFVDCYPVPEDNAAAAITHFSSHHQQANKEDFVSISKLQAQPVLPPSQRVLRNKRAKRSLVLGGAALYFGHRLFGRYSEGYLVDSCVSASVFAFKAALFAGLFGLLPVAVGRQAGRYWLGHHRPPKVIEVTVDPDKPSTARPVNLLEELLVRRHPLLFLLLFVLLNLLSTAVFTGYLQWTRQKRRFSTALKSTVAGSKRANQLKKKEMKIDKITTNNNLEKQRQKQRRSSPKLTMTSRRRPPPPPPLSHKPKQKIHITRE